MKTLQTHDTQRPSPADRAALEAYWQRFGVRRAAQQAQTPTTSTGWPAIDRLLPGGGYPQDSVTELLIRDEGTGELSLLLPALAARLSAQPTRQIGLISPPHALNAPALLAADIDCTRAPVIACRDDSERVWAVEQMARSQAFCGFVLWSDTLDDRALRRLQLAAESGACPVFVYRPLRQAGQRSPAALRLAISNNRDGQRIEVLKCRGPAGARMNGLQAARDRAWHMPLPDAPAPTRLPAGQRRAAGNDGSSLFNRSPTPHVAGPAFPPLVAR